MSEQQSSAQTYDIAVVGGGMVGLTQALLLAQHLPQARLVLLEAQPLSASEVKQYSFDERSTALSAASADLLKKLSLWSKVTQRAAPIRSVHVSDRGHMGATAYTQQENGGEPLGYVVENRHLGHCLNEAVRALPTIDLRAPAQVRRIVCTRDGALLDCETAKGEFQLQSSLVIIADGAESPLRQQLGVDTEIYDYQQQAVIANLEFVEPHRGRAFERFTTQGPLAILPLPAEDGAEVSRRSALVWTRPQSLLKETLALDDDQFKHAVQNAFGYRLGGLLRVGARYNYALKMIFAREQVRRSLVFIGNAAHFLHPVAGQGFNLALRDCAQLTAVLVQAWRRGETFGDLRVLNRYAQQQTQDQRSTAFVSHNFIRVFGSEHLSLQAARNLGLLSLELFTPLKHVFFAQMMGRAQPRANLHRKP